MAAIRFGYAWQITYPVQIFRSVVTLLILVFQASGVNFDIFGAMCYNRYHRHELV